MSRILKNIMAQPWLMTETALENMLSVVKRENDIELLASKVGKPLENHKRVEMFGTTAVIHIIGGIMRYASIFDDICGGTSTQNLVLDIKAAIENPRVKNIVLNIDSPGGQASGISELAEIIHISDKPIIAYVDDICASGAYWLASACNHIATAKTATIGSIGAVYSFRVNTDDKTIKILSSVSPKKQPNVETPEGKAQVQVWADDIGDIFVSEVARYRGVSTKKVLEKFGQGDLMIASGALKVGMIDEITTFEALLKNL